MDPLQHPDLIDVGRRLRDRLEGTLDAELEAARSAAARRRTLRDILIEAEDAGRVVLTTTSDGSIHGGRVRSVGADHVILARRHGATTVVAFDALIAIEMDR